MPVFDTPITTDNQSLPRILAQGKPTLMLLHDGSTRLDDALRTTAKNHAGTLLVVRVNAKDNPTIHAQYDHPALPALITLTAQGTVKSSAPNASAEDVTAHLDYLLNDTPLPSSIGAQMKAKADPRPVIVTEQTFEQEVLRSDLPVFVDFWATWCPPCRMIAPHVETMAKEFAGRVKIVKVDTDFAPTLSQRYQIRSIPTFITFKDGQVVSRMSGADPNGIRRMAEAVAR
ncbi:MAG: hypothetical protein OHK0046_12670 [Anaerolineae bacterium]